MIYPEFPEPGSTLGICAPSAGVGGKLESFDMSLEILRGEGYEIFETDCVRSDGYPSAPAVIRGSEFSCLFSDPELSAVLCASGGDYVLEMLPYIDQEAVLKNPKWFCGYSDPTGIELLLTTKLDIATIYGFNAGAFDWRPLHEYQLNALSVLKGDIPVQHSYDMWASGGYDEENDCYPMDAPVEWELFVPSGSGYDRELAEASHLDVTGRLIGGCIDVIYEAAGTPYEDMKGFAERYADDGLIWFFDNFSLDPLTLQYALSKMKLMGLFENARAVVIGRTVLPGEATDIEYLEQIERVFAETEVPVIWNADIGHTKPSFTIINGAMGRLTFDSGRASLSMELK